MATAPVVDTPPAALAETPVTHPKKGILSYWRLYAAISPSICCSSPSV